MRKIVGKVGGHFAKHLFLPNLEATCYVVADYGVEQPVDIVLGVALVFSVFILFYATTQSSLFSRFSPSKLPYFPNFNPLNSLICLNISNLLKTLILQCLKTPPKPLPPMGDLYAKRGGNLLLAQYGIGGASGASGVF